MNAAPNDWKPDRRLDAKVDNDFRIPLQIMRIDHDAFGSTGSNSILIEPGITRAIELKLRQAVFSFLRVRSVNSCLRSAGLNHPGKYSSILVQRWQVLEEMDAGFREKIGCESDRSFGGLSERRSEPIGIDGQAQAIVYPHREPTKVALSSA